MIEASKVLQRIVPQADIEIIEEHFRGKKGCIRHCFKNCGGLTSDSGNVALENGKVWVLQQETQHGRQLNDQRIPEINI
ncbi:MAG: hypothetical protein ACOX0T_01110 [Pelotomaculum sp.]